jgi:hypothetical protein
MPTVQQAQVAVLQFLKGQNAALGLGKVRAPAGHSIYRPSCCATTHRTRNQK